MSSSASIMISNDGTPGPKYDSTVCLLDPEATDELHNVPLDAEQPPAPEGSEPEIPTNGRNDPSRWSSSEIQVTVLLFTFVVLAFLASFTLAFYMLYLHVHYKNLLQTLTEQLDTQSQILAQMVANQIIAGYNPGGL